MGQNGSILITLDNTSDVIDNVHNVNTIKCSNNNCLVYTEEFQDLILLDGVRKLNISLRGLRDLIGEMRSFTEKNDPNHNKNVDEITKEVFAKMIIYGIVLFDENAPETPNFNFDTKIDVYIPHSFFTDNYSQIVNIYLDAFFKVKESFGNINEETENAINFLSLIQKHKTVVENYLDNRNIFSQIKSKFTNTEHFTNESQIRKLVQLTAEEVQNSNNRNLVTVNLLGLFLSIFLMNIMVNKISDNSFKNVMQDELKRDLEMEINKFSENLDRLNSCNEIKNYDIFNLIEQLNIKCKSEEIVMIKPIEISQNDIVNEIVKVEETVDAVIDTNVNKITQEEQHEIVQEINEEIEDIVAQVNEEVKQDVEQQFVYKEKEILDKIRKEEAQDKIEEEQEPDRKKRKEKKKENKKKRNKKKLELLKENKKNKKNEIIKKVNEQVKKEVDKEIEKKVIAKKKGESSVKEIVKKAVKPVAKVVPEIAKPVAVKTSCPSCPKCPECEEKIKYVDKIVEVEKKCPSCPQCPECENNVNNNIDMANKKMLKGNFPIPTTLIMNGGILLAIVLAMLIMNMDKSAVMAKMNTNIMMGALVCFFIVSLFPGSFFSIRSLSIFSIYMLIFVLVYLKGN